MVKPRVKFFFKKSISTHCYGIVHAKSATEKIGRYLGLYNFTYLASVGSGSGEKFPDPAKKGPDLQPSFLRRYILAIGNVGIP